MPARTMRAWGARLTETLTGWKRLGKQAGLLLTVERLRQVDQRVKRDVYKMNGMNILLCFMYARYSSPK